MPPRRVVTGRSQEPRQRFAEELRHLRARSGASLRQLGERLGWDWSLFGKMEKGETLGGPEVVQALDQHYGTSGMLLVLWELARGDKTQFKERYRRHMTLEAEAVSLWHFAVSVLPGLLQTRGYARELLAAGGFTGDALAQQVEARLGRRELLEGDGPPFRTILSEATLRTALRDAKAWREQLEYLAEVAERPNVTVQVLLQSAGLHGLSTTDVWFLPCRTGVRWHTPSTAMEANSSRRTPRWSACNVRTMRHVTWRFLRPSRGNSSCACWRKCRAIHRPDRRDLAQEQLQQSGRRRVRRGLRRLRCHRSRPGQQGSPRSGARVSGGWLVGLRRRRQGLSTAPLRNDHNRTASENLWVLGDRKSVV